MAWAQEAKPQDLRCEPRIVARQSAKAFPEGPPPDAALLQWVDVPPLDDWSQRWPGYDGAAWYRIDWESPCGRDQPVALAIVNMVMAGEVFVNSELIWRDQSLVEPLSRSWNMPRYWLLPRALLKEQGNSIWVRIHGISSQTPGLGRLRIGNPAELEPWTAQATWSLRTIYVVCITVSMVLCLLFAFAWLHHRHQKLYGWYALNLLCWALLLCFIVMTEPWPFASTQAFARWNLLIFIAFAYTFCIFALRFAELSLKKLERMLTGLCSLCAVFALTVPEAQMALSQAIWLLMFCLCALVCLLFPLRALQTRTPAHILFSLCFVLYLAIGVHDLLLLAKALDHNLTLIPYTTLMSMLVIAWLLGRQIVKNMRHIERFNHELSLTVTQACDDLSQTLEREHHLALSHSRLQERLRISQDLQNGLGGSLVRSIALVEQSSAPLPNAQVLSMLKLMRDDLRQMIDAGASAAIQVPETPTQWLAPLRHRFARLFEELDIGVKWIMPSHWDHAPSPIQCLALTRVLEEALTNVVKHSHAHNVLVEMSLERSCELLLRISDDGIGFDVHTVQTHSMGVGMRSMLARLERLHGSLQLQSRPGLTTLTAIMALGIAPAASAQ
ncbi:MAG: histidine kinase [Comamonas sp.]|jgi:signal transduction histidine kinase|uniref:sensor histidine kinase n=1 Tax=Comamonas sp. TaxID=34028 RepID=UPI002842BD13|nr:ATP-binding protein [Comamonas sp.]MDR3067246.1 histidine kinase [Comamonas sp.]